MQRILMIEDDRAIVDSLSEFLKSEGYETLTANGQKAALELLTEQSVDLVLLDVSLADGNGFSVCSAI